jgi:DNA adenine methylase
MDHPNLFGHETVQRIVNVASVPQRSPFRYPGGKTWLIPRIREWLAYRGTIPSVFIEPFAGGGIVSLTVAFEELAKFVVMVELDEQVAAVWKEILYGDAEWLARRILGFDLTPENAARELAKKPTSGRQLAFQTILKNRTYHGGILADGSGFLKHGENGKGIKSRWYPDTLCRRIRNIAAISDRIKFIEGDGLEMLERCSGRSDAVFFIDPPYTAAGKKAGTRLYTHCDLDHEKLFRLAQQLAGDFLMTYDNADGVIAMAQRHGFDCRKIPMKNTHHAEMTELLIGRDLAWVA